MLSKKKKKKREKIDFEIPVCFNLPLVIIYVKMKRNVLLSKR